MRIILERLVAVEKGSQKLRQRDEQIKSELDHALQPEGELLDAKHKSQSKAQRTAHFQEEQPRSPKTQKPDAFTIGTPEPAQGAGAQPSPNSNH